MNVPPTMRLSLLRTAATVVRCPRAVTSCRLRISPLAIMTASDHESRHPWTHSHQLSFAETFSSSAAVASRDRHDDDLAEEVEDGSVAAAASVNPQEVISLVDAALATRRHSATHISVEKAVTALCNGFVGLEDDSRAQRTVLDHLARQAVDREAVRKLASDYASADLSDTGAARLEDQLREALTPPYLWLFRRIGQLEGGVKFLVDLRAQLIPLTRMDAVPASSNVAASAAALKAMNGQLRQLLAHWFSVGFLKLEQVTWSSPCAMLQKVSDYEAVHPMRNWTDLKARVGAYRRCFVYTHRSMPGEPIVVLHVALTRGIPEKIASVVKHHRMVKRFSVDAIGMGSAGGDRTVAANATPEDASTCDSAIFYSITSTQTGLQGIELGTYLIKQAVRRLKEELPNISHFCTLSPIPGFRSWLLAVLKGESPDSVFTVAELEAFSKALDIEDRQQLVGAIGDSLRTNAWTADSELSEALETPLMRLCARYLYLEKRRNQAVNSVANFHLRNGAVLWRINWRADLSARGLSNSCGIMVNYKYFLDDLESNSAAYLESHTVKAGEQVAHLVSHIKR